MGLIHFLCISGIQTHESAHPGVEELERLHLVHLLDSLVRGIVSKRFAQLHIPEHRSGSVRIDLAELELSRIFVVEQIQSGNGKHTFIGLRQEDQLLQLFGERKQFADRLILAIALDHLSKNSAACLHDLLEMGSRLLIEDLRNMHCFLQNAVIFQRRILDRLFHSLGTGLIFFTVRKDLRPISLEHFILQRHIASS